MGHADNIKKLLDKGASINAMAKNGSFPLDWAIKFEHDDVAALLVDRGAENGKPLK